MQNHVIVLYTCPKTAKFLICILMILLHFSLIKEYKYTYKLEFKLLDRYSLFCNFSIKFSKYISEIFIKCLTTNMETTTTPIRMITANQTFSASFLFLNSNKRYLSISLQLIGLEICCHYHN